MGGADDRNRTGDLVITSDPLCHLSYVGTQIHCNKGKQRSRLWTG